MRGLALLSLLLLWPLAANADFAAGVRAYDGGDYATAATEWRRAAEAGSLEAQVALAGMYHAGEGMPRDLARAARWYQLAAERGDPIAQLNLGEFYRDGLGVRRSLPRAFLWLTLSARQGNGAATAARDRVAGRMTRLQRSRAAALLAARKGD